MGGYYQPNPALTSIAMRPSAPSMDISKNSVTNYIINLKRQPQLVVFFLTYI
jgi:hypothetical protein